MTLTDDIKMVVTHDRQECLPISTYKENINTLDARKRRIIKGRELIKENKSGNPTKKHE